MRWALAISVALAGISSSFAAEVRPASEEEIAAALIGCWEEEKRANSLTNWTMCFDATGEVTTMRDGPDGGAFVETFDVADGKLIITGGPYPHYGLEWTKRTCDVLMRVDVAMRLDNCVSSYKGEQVISEGEFGSTSYAKVQE